MKQFISKNDQAHSYIICRFDQCILIDPSDNIDEIKEYLEDKKLIAIAITHGHSDHVNLIHKFKVPIYISEHDAHLLFEDDYNGYDKKNKRPFQRKELDIHLIKNESSIALADKEVKVIETPGHTKGGLSFLYGKHLFTGDTLFKNDVGRHDLYSGNLSELKQSVVKLIDEMPENTIICPGHDELSLVKNERKSNPYYIKWQKQKR
ncbi:conserved hypothetical protein, beta-lactamase family protein [Alteracholeplasma palmae J233]|uniref:Metallo-beta-lactamase domain-containing protein n=1 Tax=Alteracholeplasma palmae (strain ATCC 49389 / J233) TaxID=1318466 RepID=U4KKW8_ALTPJ|nr:MBL fold metallo-hydrolase [Alteracholeplasma palmae]CCV64338.1 conserved hypothetical protein, beta-lactamase family protein [Alteracholeplasma palmae J233]